jgi:hypothetical protein
MMGMKKEKEKPKRGDNPHHIEFVTSLKQSECIARLETFQYSGCLRQTVKVEFSQLDRNTYKFTLVRGNRARLRGHLINQYGLSTRVEGNASITGSVIVAIIMATLFSIFMMVAVFDIVIQGRLSNLWLIVYPVVAVATIYQMLQEPHRLAADIQNLLLEQSD